MSHTENPNAETPLFIPNFELEDDLILDPEEYSEDKILEEDEGTKVVMFRLLKGPNHKPNLTTDAGHALDMGYPKSYYMPTDDVITFRDEEGKKGAKSKYHGKNRTIRYIEGEPSIYKDEQSDDAQPKFGTIVFTDGVLRIHPDENPTLIEYLRNMNHNATNPNAIRRKKVFEEIIQGREEKVNDKLIDLRYKAVGLVQDLKNDDLLLFNKYVNNPTKGKSVIQLKTALKIYAEQNPQKFIDIFNDPKLKIKQLFVLAQERRVISYSEVPNALVWINGSNRTPITNIPAGSDPLEWLADWASLKEGNADFNMIKHKTKEAGKR